MRSLATLRPRNNSPVPLVSSRAAGWLVPRGAGFAAQQDAVESVGTLYGVVRRLATATAKLEWKLYTRPLSGLKEDRTEVTRHAALDLWNKPNPFMSQRRFVQTFSQHKEATGEANLIVGYVGKVPLELWPVLPDRIEPVPDPYAFLRGWKYTGPNGERIPLEPSELLRVVDPAQRDMYRGSSPVKALLTDLDVNRLSSEWQRNFFTNSARPGGVIEVDRRLSDPEFDEMRERWAEQHQGVNKAHRVAIIENGAKWVDASVSQRDMQFVEIDERQRDKVLEALGFPRAALGISQDVNRANAEAGEYFFAKWLIEERADSIKDMLNFELLPLYGKDQPRLYEWDYVSPVSEDANQEMQALTARSNAARTLLSVPAVQFEPAEVLEAVGLPDLAYTERATPLPTAAAGDPSSRFADESTFDLAMRWVVEAHLDGNVCDPCRENDGKTYRNRASAYEDYPNGQGYVHCVGAAYGNTCRCKVVKRRRRS